MIKQTLIRGKLWRQLRRLPGWPAYLPAQFSIILNGKAKERKISSATEKEVLAIAASIGYRHNVGAASLRAADSTFHYQIVIFWIADYRAEMMTRFF